MTFKKWLMSLMVLLLAVDMAVLLDIPVLRPVLGFLFFITIPGLLILYILKLNGIGFLKKFLLSVGLSLSFLIFLGLLVNTLLFWLGYSTPLSTLSLVISLSLATIILCFGAYWRNRKGIQFTFLSKLGEDFRGKRLSLLLLPILFPILTILGRQVVEAGGSNTILVGTFILIPLYVVLLMWQNKNVPKITYPLAIGMISASILLTRGLISNYLIGGDIYSEYHSFQVVSTNLRWSMELERSNSSASLSVSLLPAMLQSILGINPLYIFKVVLLIPVSLIPVICYVTYEKYLGHLYGFLAAFFYVSQLPFVFILTGVIRVGISLISFGLIIMVLFDDHITAWNKKVLLLILLFSLVVEYYATPLIFLVIGCALILVPKTWRVGFGAQTLKTLTIISAFVLPVVLIYLWWGQITATAIYQYVWYSKQIVTNLSNLFLGELRDQTITALYTLPDLPLFAQVPGWVQRLTIVAVATGVVSILVRRGQRFRFGDYAILMATSLAILIAFIVLPWISLGYGADRLYMQPLIILAPAFIVGCQEISNGIRAVCVYLNKPVRFIMSGPYFQSIQLKSLLPILIGVILVLQFFSATYLYNQLFYPVEAREVLDSESKYYIERYVYDSEVQAARWLGANSPGTTRVYFGNIHQLGSGEVFEFTDYGVGREFIVQEFPKEDPIKDSYTFLDHLNLFDKRVVGISYRYGVAIADRIPLSEYAFLYVDKNKVYANGKAEIYR